MTAVSIWAIMLGLIKEEFLSWCSEMWAGIDAWGIRISPTGIAMASPSAFLLGIR